MLNALLSIGSAFIRGAGSLSVRRAILRRVCRELTREFTKSHPRYHSQHGQDLFVDNFLLRGKRGGVFVDIGAYDGLTLSNTYYFERELGWTGICIEPNPRAFQKLQSVRNCTTINAGVSNVSKIAKMLVLPEDGEMGSGFLEHYPPQYQDPAWLDGMVKKGAEVHDISLQNINQLFKDMEIREIDFLSIDTEGADFAILKCIDLSSTRVDVITIENSSYGDAVNEYLSKQGYSLRAVLGTDEIYKLN